MPTINHIQYADYEGEQSGVSFLLPDVATDGSNYNAVETAAAGIAVAMGALQRGAAIKRQKTIVTRLQPPGFKAANVEAQREEKWLVTYYDTQQWLDPPTNTIPNPNHNKVYNLEIPNADLSIRENSSEFIADGGVSTVTSALVQAFIDAFNADAVSPSGTSVAVLRIQSVGRNT